MRDSAEDSDDELRQPPNAVVSTSKENRKENNKTPPRDSDTGSPIPVIEYEDTRNDVELTEENIQGIVSLRMERNAVKGETRKEVLERLMPTVVLKDINKDKNDKGHFEPK